MTHPEPIFTTLGDAGLLALALAGWIGRERLARWRRACRETRAPSPPPAKPGDAR